MSEKVGIGVIGVGGIGGSIHVPNIVKNERCTLTGVFDTDEETMKKKAADNNCKAYAGMDEMMDDPALEAVLIATPHYFHTPLTIRAFEAGKHVLTEKPIAVHKADAEKMIEAHGKRPDLRFAAMFNQRTIPSHKKIKELIDQGTLGEIRRISWVVTDWFRTQRYYDSGTWRATWKGEGGGVLLNQCPHQLDLFQWFFGMPVQMRAFCDLGKWHDIEVEDDVTAYFKFTNGATGVFISSTGEAPGSNRLEIAGDNGKLVFENGLHFTRNEVPASEFLKTCTQSFAKPPIWHCDIPVHGDGGGQHMNILDNFAQAIRNEKVDLIAPAADGLKSVELANAMLLSAMKEKTIDLPMYSAEYETLLNDLIEKSKFVKKDAVKNTDGINNSL